MSHKQAKRDRNRAEPKCGQTEILGVYSFQLKTDAISQLEWMTMLGELYESTANDEERPITALGDQILERTAENHHDWIATPTIEFCEVLERGHRKHRWLLNGSCSHNPMARPPSTSMTLAAFDKIGSVS